VQHALDVQRALATGNYHKLCALYLTAPFMGPYIMDHFIDRERVKGLMVMTRASVPRCSSQWSPLLTAMPYVFSYKTLTLPFLQKTLAFDTLEDARTFLTDHNLASYFSNLNSPDSEKVIDCKLVSPELNRVYEEKYRKVAIRGAI